MASEQFNLKKFIFSLAPDVGEAIRRFPYSVILAAAYTLFFVLDIDKVLGLSKETTFKTAAALSVGFFWSVAGGFFTLTRGWSEIKQLTFLIPGLVFITAVIFARQWLDLHVLMFASVFVLLIGLAAHMRSNANQAGFWLFNHRIWLGAIIALIGACLFAGGISLIIETLNYLFGIKIFTHWHKDVWTIALGFIAPVNWLSFMPHDYDEEVTQGEQTEFTSRAVAIIVKFILVPLLLVYTAILYAYAAKIGIEGVLPKGRLAAMVLAYGALGTLTILLAYPSRHAGGPLVSFFWRHWYWLTLGPIVMLFLAAYTRIAQYGVTDERYMLLLIGGWLAFLALIFAFWRRERDIRIIPASLIVVLLIASLGPWGAQGFAARSQINILSGLLEKHKILQNGEIRQTKVVQEINSKDARRIRSILSYMRRAKIMHKLTPWYKNWEKSPLKKDASSYQQYSAVLKSFSFQGARVVASKRKNYSYYSNKSNGYALQGYNNLYGPVNFNSYSKDKNALKEFKVISSPEVKVEIKGHLMTIKRGESEQIQYDLNEVILEVIRREEKLKQVGKVQKDYLPQVFEKQSQTLNSKLIFNRLSARKRKDEKPGYENFNGQVWIMLN